MNLLIVDCYENSDCAVSSSKTSFRMTKLVELLSYPLLVLETDSKQTFIETCYDQKYAYKYCLDGCTYVCRATEALH